MAASIAVSQKTAIQNEDRCSEMILSYLCPKAKPGRLSRLTFSICLLTPARALPIIERIPTKRTTATPTRSKPLEQTPTMKQILTRTASLIRHLLITAHNTIANRTFRLALQRTLYVPLKRCQRIDQRAIEQRDSAQGSAKPRLPFLFVDSNAIQAFYVRICEREGGR